LAFYRAAGDRDGEAWALNGLGEAVHGAGSGAEALDHFAGARAIATELGLRDQVARAHAGLAHAHQAVGHPLLARRHLEEAINRYTELDMPEAGQLRSAAVGW